MKILENLKWRPMWTTQIGAVQGCLEYLGVEVSDAWLFGGTGHAFFMNVHERVCASGPTAWNTEMLFKLGGNVGYAVERVQGCKRDEDFAEKQKLAWEQTRKAVDEKLPCYGWELGIPEYYVVNGYDDRGYYFHGPLCERTEGPKRWEELANTGIGVLEMCVVRACERADDIATIKGGLGFAVEQWKAPDKWTLPLYKTGLAGYEAWINALRNETAIGTGVAYNAAVWSECRAQAVEFLREAKDRVAGRCGELFDEAIRDYEVAAAGLKAVAEYFPFLNVSDEERESNVKEAARRAAGLKHLSGAKAAEKSGLKTLAEILATI